MRLALTMLVAACSATPPAVSSPSGGAAAPAPGANDLARLDAAAEAGDAKAAWQQVHMLIDLFDAARFGGDAGARAALLQALRVVEADRARAAITDEALDRMLVAVDRLLRVERLSPEGRAARALLDHDRRAASGRDDLYRRAAALKGVARGGGPLAANAALRLAGVCLQAFRDAVRAPLHERGERLAFCLYPLWDSDPEPYFDVDPRRRPPPPAWLDLDARLQKLLSTVAAGGSRVAPAANAALAAHRELVRKAEADRLFLPRLEPGELRVPLVADAPLLYDGEPIVLGAGEVSAGGLEPLVRADDRRRVALALPADASAQDLAVAAAAARAAGARTIGLGVGVEQTVKAPAGDYWEGRAKIPRLGLYPIAVAGGEDARASLALHLVVSPSKWDIVAPAGALPSMPADPARLREALAAVRRAFPDEDGLFVVPGAPVGTVVAALAAARQAGFRYAALADRAPSAAGELAERVRRRAAADVTIVPDSLAERGAAVRGCFLAALDRNPRTAGTIELVQAQGKLKVSGAGDGPLRQCVQDRLGPRMQADGIPLVRVELTESRTPR